MRVVLWLLFLSLMNFASAPAFAAWKRAESPHFIVYSDGSEQELRRFTARLETLDQIMRAFTRRESEAPPIKLRIYLFASDVQVRRYMPDPKASENVRGFYRIGSSGAIALVDRSKAQGEYELGGEEVLYHEYAHHFMFQTDAFAYPLWFIEGFAEYFAPTSIKDYGKVKVGMPATYRLYGLYNETWLSLRTLFNSDLSKMSLDKMELFYGQSWYLVHYLFDTPERRPQLVNFLHAVNRGTPTDEAFQTAFKTDYETLDKELRKSFNTRKIGIRIVDGLASALDEVKINMLSPVEAAMLPTQIRNSSTFPEARAKEYVQEARKAAALFPENNYARATLAEAEFTAGEQGDVAAAERLVDLVLKSEPDNVRALSLKAAIVLRSADKSADPLATMREGRRWAVKANRLNPDDPEVLVNYYSSFSLEPKGVSDNALNGLLRAYDLVPQYDAMGYIAASELLKRGRAEEAIHILQPIANRPHGGSYSSQAAELLSSAKQKAQEAKAKGEGALKPVAAASGK